MNWAIWLLLLGWSATPITLLVVDRVFDVDSHRVLRSVGWVFAATSVVLIGGAWLVDVDYVELVAWGALVGFLGTVTLDVVRLIGLKLGAFPLDMPIVFGAMATGTIRRLQHLVMGQVLHNELVAGDLRQFVAARVSMVPRLSEHQRVNAVATMMGAISTLSESEAEQVSKAQFETLSRLEPGDRRTVMQAMDAASSAAHPGQPRGLPRVPMAKFQPAAESAMKMFRSENPDGFRVAFLAGYFWHAVNGISFGIMYGLIFGQGSWVWALAWGTAVWLAMMVSMPFMMPTLKLPPWFLIVPFVAHVAMVLPFLALRTWVPDAANAVSFVGWLAR